MAFDASKNRENLKKHGLSLADADDLDWDTAITNVDTRKDYAEVRLITYAIAFGRVHCLVWTSRDGAIRPISFRKANAREIKKYEKERE